MENYYVILEVQESATSEQIKQAYRTLLQVWHPDRFQSNPMLLAKAEQKTRNLNRAFEILSNPALRRQYDATFHCSQPDGEPRQKEGGHTPCTTRCPNPTCELVLRISSRNVGKVTCPLCRTTFKYDPQRNEKWDVFYPAAGAQEQKSNQKENSPCSSEYDALDASKQAPFFTVEKLAVSLIALVVVGSAISLLWAANKRTSVETVTDHSVSDRRELAELEQRFSTNNSPSNGDELIPATGVHGIGQLKIVNATSVDTVAKLLREDDSPRLLRYWFIEAGKSVEVDDLGPCECLLYFGFGKEWDNKLMKFRLRRSYGVYDEALSFTEKNTPGGLKSQNFMVELIGSNGGIERVSAIEESMFNNLY